MGSTVRKIALRKIMVKYLQKWGGDLQPLSYTLACVFFSLLRPDPEIYFLFYYCPGQEKRQTFLLAPLP